MTTMGRVSWMIATSVVLAACGGSSDDTELERAEAKVAAEEKDLSEAQAKADETVAKFCGASETYIIALDRYGDVLSSTAPTVGDVTEAGADLADPGKDATKAAEAAVKAQEELRAADQELKDARAALKDVRATSGPSRSEESDPKVKATPHPLPPDDVVNRVEQAESELVSAQGGINDETPLVQASQQFNAAAVALEMSWLHLYAEAGCFADDQQKEAEAAAAHYTSTLQQALSEAGYYQGPVDGIYGPETVDAVEAVQQAHGLPVTGTVDKATAAALDADLQEKGGAAAQQALASTAAVQQTLKLAGFWDGPIDGSWTPELTDALKDFQAELGVEPTGTVDAATVAAVENAIAAAEEPEQESPSESESLTEPTATAGETAS